MGKKASKETVMVLSEDLFSVKVSKEDENKWGIMTKSMYQEERHNSTMNVQKDLLYHVLGEAVSKEDIRNIYIFDKKVLGKGHFGYVRRAKFICDSTRNYVIKSIPIAELSSDAYLLKRELEILRLMDHPNIIKFFDYYKDQKYLHLVMENCSGGTLFSKLMADKRLEEDLIRAVMFQILYAVNHLHDRGICHRDLRLDNFLIMNRSHQHVVKLADFGLCKMFSSSELKTRVGAYHYIAPEIFEGAYTPMVDSWSVGVMLYMMITGEPPFTGKTPNDVYARIRDGGFALNQPVWDTVSPGAKELTQALLTKDPVKRMTITKALDHPWFAPLHLQYNDLGSFHLKKDLLERFKSYRKISKLQKEVIKLMVIIFHDTDEVEKLRHVFFYLDELNHGVLTVKELKDFFNKFGEAVSESDIETILKDLNLRFKNSITLSEFIAVTIEPFFVKDEKNIKAIYNRLKMQLPPAEFTLKPIDEVIELHPPPHLRMPKPDMVRDGLMSRDPSVFNGGGLHPGEDSEDFKGKSTTNIKDQLGATERKTPTGASNPVIFPAAVQTLPVNGISSIQTTPHNGATTTGINHSKLATKKQKWEKERPPEMTGRILGMSLAKFGLLIQTEDFNKMAQDALKGKGQEDQDTEITYEEFVNAMTEIFN
jgi:calcium-dependent protein kinase